MLRWTNARRAENRARTDFRLVVRAKRQASRGQKEEKKIKKRKEKRRKSRFRRKINKSTDKTDHGSTATAVVGIHAESHDTRRRLVLLQTHGSLAPRTTDDIEIGIHRVGVCGGGGNVFCTAAGGLRLDLDRRRTHCVWYCISVGTDWLVVVVVV